MEKGIEIAKIFSGFSKLDRADRLGRLLQIGALTAADVTFLNSGGLENTDLAEKLIENVIGYFQIPLGVLTPRASRRLLRSP